MIGSAKKRAWLALDEASLERLLIERWLVRGLMLVAMLASALAITVLAMGRITPQGKLTIIALIVLALGAGIAAFVMRLTDLDLYRELQRRRKGHHPPLPDAPDG